ncbi:jg12587 [Pararge aegeria aegeria]|uniref:Jg12587 protein n=1 Tax=Pararge aegeria aegeria TaxID=348720 RepID=A0A8S4SCL4_9NEOP|nr:jg12587 [Pararge aegeria aegeria]
MVSPKSRESLPRITTLGRGFAGRRSCSSSTEEAAANSPLVASYDMYSYSDLPSRHHMKAERKLEILPRGVQVFILSSNSHQSWRHTCDDAAQRGGAAAAREFWDHLPRQHYLLYVDMFMPLQVNP